MPDANSGSTKQAAGVALLLEQTARKVLVKRTQQDLHAVQWSALRYFRRAGRQTATVNGLSRFLGNTSGSTSRTAKTLVERGLLKTSPSPIDARSMTFSLTSEGEKMLKSDPLHDLSSVLSEMSPEDLGRLGELLDLVSSRLSHTRETD